MHQLVRTRVTRNAEYHEAVAEHFAGLQKKATNGNGNGGNGQPEPKGDDTPSAARRSAAKPEPAPQMPGQYSSEDLAKLVAMHAGAAEDLRAVLATDQPQAIITARAQAPVKRQTGPVSLKVH